MCYHVTMSKITDYLNERLDGEVASGEEVRRQFATDGSVLSIAPSLVVYPRGVDDVRKIARFTWRLAERGQVLPLTARGNGTDPTGAALSRGTILSMPAHMAQVMEFDLKQRLIRIQAGISLETLRQATATQGLWLPIDGGSTRAMTAGGAIANDALGRRFAKYGTMRDWVDKLEVVLANGEVIETGRISRRELDDKKGLQTLEGEIYRAVDQLIDENAEAISHISSGDVLRGGGYALDFVKAENGSFDLTPLFVGSQGTLGVITQAIIHLNDLPREEGIIVFALNGDEDMAKLTNELLELKPEALEFIDGETLTLIREYTGMQPWKSVTSDLPYALVFVEFDDKHMMRQLRKAGKIMEAAGITNAKIAYTPGDVDDVMKIYDSVAVVTNRSEHGAAAVPLATNLSVQSGNIFELVDAIRKMTKRLHLDVGVWGNIAAGSITIRPVVNLANLSQRRSLILMIEGLAELVRQADGSLAGVGGGGRLLSPWLMREYDKQTVNLFANVRHIFDPYGILNTGVKDGQITPADTEILLRQTYHNELSTRYYLRG